MYKDHDLADLVLHDLIFNKNCMVKYDLLSQQFYITRGKYTFTIAVKVRMTGNQAQYLVAIKEYEELVKHMERIYEV